jgi:hypothetical protein
MSTMAAPPTVAVGASRPTLHRGSQPKGRTSLRSVRPEALDRDVVVGRALTLRILACREDSSLQ